MDRWTLMEQSLADIGDGEQLIDTKVGGMDSTDSQLRPSKVCLMRVIWAYAWCIKVLTTERIDAHSWNKV